jgi:hypothetical protein
MQARSEAVLSIKEMVAKIMKQRERAVDAIATTSVMGATVCPVCFNRRWVSEHDETPGQPTLKAAPKAAPLGCGRP